MAFVTLEARIGELFTRLSDRPVLGPLARFCVRRREQILYLVVGGWNTLFGYAIWAFLNYLLHPYLHYLAIVVISWPFAVANAYVCYRCFVFRSKGSVWRELPRFSIVYVVTLVLNLIVLPILLRVVPLNLYVIQALFMAAMVVLSYLAHKYISFRAGGRGRAPKDAERQDTERIET
jgi:putative flippase GtrA